MYGSTIIKRWRKRTPAQRRAILVDFEPDICEKENTVIWSLINLIYKPRTSDNYQLRPAELGLERPWFNVERLCTDASRFIGLLLHRTLGHPSDFTVFDLREGHLGWLFGASCVPYTPGMMRLGREGYGCLEDLKLQDLHRGVAISASQADVAMRCHALILAYCWDVCTRLLFNDLPPISAANMSWAKDKLAREGRSDQLPEKLPNLKLTSAISEGPITDASCDNVKEYLKKCGRGCFVEGKVTVPHEDLAFYPPPKGHLADITNVIHDRVMELKDELVELQTSPQYLARRVLIVDKPQLEAVINQLQLTVAHKTHYLPREAMLGAVEYYLQWAVLDEELQYAMSLQQRDPGEAYSPEFVRTHSALRCQVRSMQERIRHRLQQRVLSLSSLRNMLKLEDTNKKHPKATIEVDIATNFVMKNDDDDLFCLFLATCSNSTKTALLRKKQASSLSLLYKAKDSGSRVATALSDSIIQDLISDLAVLEHVVIHLDLMTPLVIKISPSKASGSLRPFWFLLESMTASRVTASHAYSSKIASAADTLQSMVKCTKLGSPVDIQALGQFEESHRLLQVAWREAEAALAAAHQHLPDSIRDKVRDVLFYYNDPYHVAEVASACARYRQAFQGIEAQIERFSIDPQPGSTRDFDRPETKEKTRITSTESPQASPSKQTSGDEIPNAIVLYQLSSDVMEVVDALFGNDAGEGAVQTIKWPDFCSLMKALGFSTQPRGGSKYHFEGDINLQREDYKASEHRSILIHRPHPEDEMTKYKLREIGRRCRRHFGWERASFAEEIATRA